MPMADKDAPQESFLGDGAFPIRPNELTLRSCGLGTARNGERENNWYGERAVIDPPGQFAAAEPMKGSAVP